MSQTSILGDLVILFAAALPIVVVFQRLQLPTVIGFVIAGAAIGPHGLGFIAESAHVESLAEVGLVLLLFVVGLELSLRELLRFGRRLITPAVLQVALTILATVAVAVMAGFATAEAVLIGFAIVHSSTAIVLKVLGDRGEIHAPHGRVAVGILLVQDLCFVPMILLVRLLATPGSTAWSTVALVLIKAVVAILVILLIARLLVPVLLRHIVQLGSRELFTATMVFLCLGSAWAASQLGLSLAIGALIAGLVISDSEYSHQAVADVLPFRDAFNSIFFISMGMLLRPDFVLSHAGGLVAAAAAIIAFKAVIVVAVVLPFYHSLRIATGAALALAAVGELSFVLAQFALGAGLLSSLHYEWFIAAAIMTMMAAPFLIRAAPALSARLTAAVGWREAEEDAGRGKGSRTHVVIVGYGLNGENLAHVLRQTGLSYTILELSPDRVADAQRRDEPVTYGDATRTDVLKAAGVAHAHVVVIAISDPAATRRIVAIARQLNPEAPVIVRTRYVSEIDDLQRLGATEVVPEEFETSVQIFARVLRRLRVPRNVITVQVQLIRQKEYSLLRGVELPQQTLSQLDQILAATLTETFLLPETSPAVGVSIRDLRLRRETGVTIIAIVRNGKPLTNPPPETVLEANDVVVLVGSHAQLDQALARLGESAETEP